MNRLCHFKCLHRSSQHRKQKHCYYQIEVLIHEDKSIDHHKLNKKFILPKEKRKKQTVYRSEEDF